MSKHLCAAHDPSSGSSLFNKVSSPDVGAQPATGGVSARVCGRHRGSATGARDWAPGSEHIFSHSCSSSSPDVWRKVNRSCAMIESGRWGCSSAVKPKGGCPARCSDAHDHAASDRPRHASVQVARGGEGAAEPPTDPAATVTRTTRRARAPPPRFDAAPATQTRRGAAALRYAKLSTIPTNLDCPPPPLQLAFGTGHGDGV